MKENIIYENKNFKVLDIGPKLLDVVFKTATHKLFENDTSGIPFPIQALMKATNLTSEALWKITEGNDRWADEVKEIIRSRHKK